MEKLKDLGFGEKADIGIVINELVKVVHILRQKVEDLESRSATSDEGIRIREENADEIKQRQLKGSLLLSCSKSDSSSPSLIKSNEELGSCSLINHVTDIINKKYKVKGTKRRCASLSSSAQWKYYYKNNKNKKVLEWIQHQLLPEFTPYQDLKQSPV